MEEKRYTLKLILIIMMIAAFASQAYAAVEWEAGIKVKIRNAGNTVNLGQKADAVDGCDARYEVPAMLAGDVMAYFIRGNKELWRDIKGIALDSLKEWYMSIESPVIGEPVTISWDPDALPGGLTLTDPSAGVKVNMKELNSYVYTNTGHKKLIIQIVGGKQ
jgi:hypothetical protein